MSAALTVMLLCAFVLVIVVAVDVARVNRRRDRNRRYYGPDGRWRLP